MNKVLAMELMLLIGVTYGYNWIVFNIANDSLIYIRVFY